jgi:hypothetical protein
MGRVPKQSTRPEPVQIELNGKLHTGTYTVAPDGTVTVSCAFGSKSAHNGSIGHQHYAKFLLAELIPKDA